jgi:hypothetical protein
MASKISNAGYGFRHRPANDTVQGLFTNPASTLIYFGLQHASNLPTTAALAPSEAWNIDTKMDDGRPGYGALQSANATLRPNCASSDDPNLAVYELAHTGITCNLYYMGLGR